VKSTLPGLFDRSCRVKGLVDLDNEIAKCDKKLGLAQLNLDKIIKIESQPNYKETIPANVRLANEDKVCIGSLPKLSNLTVPVVSEKNLRSGNRHAAVIERNVCEVEMIKLAYPAARC